MSSLSNILTSVAGEKVVGGGDGASAAGNRDPPPHADSGAIVVSGGAAMTTSAPGAGADLPDLLQLPVIQAGLDAFATTVENFLAALRFAARKDGRALQQLDGVCHMFAALQASPSKWQAVQQLARDFHKALIDVATRLQRKDASAVRDIGTLQMLRDVDFVALFGKSSAKVRDKLLQHLDAICSSAGACVSFAAFPAPLMASVQQMATMAAKELEKNGTLDFSAMISQAFATISSSDEATQEALAGVIEGGAGVNLAAFARHVSAQNSMIPGLSQGLSDALGKLGEIQGNTLGSAAAPARKRHR